jgi:hypothetical protein
MGTGLTSNRRVAGLATIMVTGLILAACNGASAAPSSQVTQPSKQPVASARVPDPPEFKPQIVGLVDKGSAVPYHRDQPFPLVDTAEVAPYAAAFSGTVVNETWAQLEPTDGTFDFSSIDASLAVVTAYNRSHPHSPLAVKLRVWPGFTAPSWAKALDNGPITVASRLQETGTGTDGEWWKPDYRAAWSDLQHALAARYDSSPLVRSVAATSCASLTDEPFNMAGTPADLHQMIADGWTDQEQQQCLDGTFADYSGWKHTPIDFTFNPFKYVDTMSDRYTGDEAVTDEVMTRCAQSEAKGGPLCILSNHTLSQASTAASSVVAPVYAEIDSLWAKQPAETPVDLQTVSPHQLDLCPAIGVAIAHHAQSVEVWPDTEGVPGFGRLPLPTLTALAEALATGRSPAC